MYYSEESSKFLSKYCLYQWVTNYWKRVFKNQKIIGVWLAVIIMGCCVIWCLVHLYSLPTWCKFCNLNCIKHWISFFTYRISIGKISPTERPYQLKCLSKANLKWLQLYARIFSKSYLRCVFFLLALPLFDCWWMEKTETERCDWPRSVALTATQSGNSSISPGSLFIVLLYTTTSP